MGRRFLGLVAGVAALTWLGCGVASAAVGIDPLDPDTRRLVDRAHGLAHHIDDHHYYDGEESSWDDHCEGHQLYDALSLRYAEYTLRGDVRGAALIGAELGHLGEELSYDEFLTELVFNDPYPPCWCFLEELFGPHYSFVEVQGGWLRNYAGIEDTTAKSSAGVLGVGVGIAVPVTGGIANYAFLKATWYASNGSTDLFPGSGWSSRVNWIATGDAGFGGPIAKTGANWRASVGGALGSRTVDTPFGSDTRTNWGYTTDLGIDYDIMPRWKLTADWRWVHLRQQEFTPGPFHFDYAHSQNMLLLGLRYQFVDSRP